MSEALQIQTERIDPDITVVSMTGKIVMGPDSMEVEALVSRLVEKNEKKVIFDLSHVDYLDSTGLGAIAHSFALLQRAGGGLRLAGAGDRIQAHIRATRLDSMVPTFPTVAEATRNF
jgi:anti-sigma B factor antagonist